MNIQEWALTWFNEQRNAYIAESVTIMTSTGNFNVQASVINPGTEVSSSGARTKTNKTLFIVNTADITDAVLQRGVKISRPGYGIYEVIIDKISEVYFNDPNKLETVIPTKIKCS